MPLRATGREREDGLEAVQGLNRALLVEGEHSRMARRVQVEPNDVGGFRLEVGGRRGHIAPKPIRLHAGPGPDPCPPRGWPRSRAPNPARPSRTKRSFHRLM